jgi:adenosine deaminase
MRPRKSLNQKVITVLASVAILLSWITLAHAQALKNNRGSGTPEQRTQHYFEEVLQQPQQLMAFLLKMPKGADLHNHLSGAIYAESYIKWSADKGLCVNQTTMTLVTCDPSGNQVPMSAALTNSVLYRQLIDAWSMRNWTLSGQSGHDHFFDTFGKFGQATYGQNGQMLAEEVARAARGHVSYEELMLTPDGGLSSTIGGQVGWDGNFHQSLAKLKEKGIADAVAQSKKNLLIAEQEKDRLLKCQTPQADPGCGVKVRYIFQVSRGSALGQVYAQMVTAFMSASDPDSKVVAVNLVQAEDGLSSMQNFALQMQMLDFLHREYPKAHVTLHAGELAPGLVPPDGLSFHIRQSVLLGHAERIGHGVDIMHEDDPEELLREMARRDVMVETCLTSNDVILGIRGKQHPLSTFIQFGVPVALATDDEGVLRSEISIEYLKGVTEQNLSYLQLKTMARNSLQYAFLSGESLWVDHKKFIPVSQCARDVGTRNSPSKSCQGFLSANEKADLQWGLETDFKVFEEHF